MKHHGNGNLQRLRRRPGCGGRRTALLQKLRRILSNGTNSGRPSCPNASLWDWQPTADGGAELLQYKGDAPVVTVPAELGGAQSPHWPKVPFTSKKKIARISLPDCVHTIGRLAFCKCLALEEVILPPSASVHRQRRLYTVPCPASPPPSSVGGGHRRRRFQRLRDSGKPWTLPPGLRELRLLTCYGCSRLRTLTLPPTLDLIQDSALCQCAALTQLHLPGTLRKIGTMAFWGCDQLTELYMPPFGQRDGTAGLRPTQPFSAFTVGKTRLLRRRLGGTERLPLSILLNTNMHHVIMRRLSS